MAKEKRPPSVKQRKLIADIFVYAVLIIMCIVWLLPFFWLLMQSFRQEPGQFIETFLPKNYTLNNYIRLFTETNVIDFKRMFFNTFIVAIFTCIISTFFVL